MHEPITIITNNQLDIKLPQELWKTREFNNILLNTVMPYITKTQ